MITNMKKRAEFALDQMGWWIIGILVLAIVLGGYMVLKSKGDGAIEYVKNLFNFGQIGIEFILMN